MQCVEHEYKHINSDIYCNWVSNKPRASDCLVLFYEKIRCVCLCTAAQGASHSWFPSFSMRFDKMLCKCLLTVICKGWTLVHRSPVFTFSPIRETAIWWLLHPGPGHYYKHNLCDCSMQKYNRAERAGSADPLWLWPAELRVGEQYNPDGKR